MTVTASKAAETMQDGVAEGITLIRAGKYNEAVVVLRGAVAKAPEDQQALLQLGVALNRSFGGKEAESLLKQALMNEPENAAVNYELGLHYFNKEVYAEAADYFESTLDLAPGSDLALKSRDYLAKIEVLTREKPWELNIAAGMQYDSNVILNGRDMPMPQGYSKKSDWSGLFSLRGNYTLHKSDQSDVTIGDTFYQSLHTKLNQFDITQNLLDLTGGFNLSGNFRVKGSYGFEYVLLNGSKYNHAHILSPSLIFSPGESWGTTTLDYRYRKNTYKNSLDFDDNSQRNGANHFGGITHTLQVSSTVTVRGEYSHDVDGTLNDFWDYSGNRGLLGLRLRLPLELVADLSGELYDKKYHAGDPVFALTTRHDSQYSCSLDLTRILSDIFSVTYSNRFIRNKSNIAEFDYNRYITSLIVNARF
jgi:tetratricopeptide (TPR) repeat protein